MPEVPPENFLLNGGDDNNLFRKSREARLFSTVIFGGVDGQDLSRLVEIIGCTYGGHGIAGLDFLYTDAAKNKSLGEVGPFDVGDESLRVNFSINGPEGERTTAIGIHRKRPEWLAGLKVV